MGKDSKIAWCHDTFNPWIGCQRISEACKNCYAAVSTPARTNRAKGLELWGPPATTARQRTAAANWKLPLRWNHKAKASGMRRRVFCASLADVFEAHADLDAMRADLWRLVEACDALDWLLLTKRPEHIRAMVPPAWLESWPAHVWVGCTVENQARAAERIPHLLGVPALVRFLSVEPLAEELDLSEWLSRRERLTPRQLGAAPLGSFCSVMGCAEESPCPVHHRLSWVIVGGESGDRARPFDLAWARKLRDQCHEAGVAFFMKQFGARPIGEWGARKPPQMHPHLVRRGEWVLNDRAGADISEWPEDLRVQEFPESH